MRILLRRCAVVAVVIACFLIPATASYALWSVLATGTVKVTTAAAAGITYYLENPGSGPTTSSATPLPLTTTAPTDTTLVNYDTNRDSDAGLMLVKGEGLSTTDATKHQLWSVTGPVVRTAPVKLVLWSAMKGFDRTKNGAVTVGLYSCDNNNSFSGCTLLAQSTVAPSGAWSGVSGSWVQKEWSFGTLALNIPSSGRLYVKLAVTSGSGDDMWFAYDTSAQPSALIIG